MIEREYSQQEKFEIERCLSKVRSSINSFISENGNDIFERTGLDKVSVNLDHVYYIGGTLCFDITFGKEKCLIMMNISDETITTVKDCKTTRRLMSISHLWFAFTIYKAVKGYHTNYYRHCYNKSCIRHLYTIMMEKRGSWASEFVEMFINSAFKAIDDLVFKMDLNYQMPNK